MAKRKKLILGAAATAIVILLVAMIISGQRGLAVETAVIEEKEIIRTVLANGCFEAAAKWELVAQDFITIKQVLVTPGDKIKEGQPLAVIDTTSIAAEKQTAQAELVAISARLSGLEATLPLRQTEAESQLAAAQRSRQQAEKEAMAMTKLYEDGAVSELDWERAQSALATQQAREQTARVQVAQIKSDVALIRQYQEQIQALESRLRLLEEKLAYYQMKAPVDGQVVEVYVKAGDVAGAGTPLIIIAGPDLIIKAEVLAQDAPELAEGQKAVISGEVLGNEKLTGRVSRIHPQAIEKLSELGVVQRRVSIEIVPDKKPAHMRPGYPVEVEIISAKTTALALPREAVFRLDGKQRVFTIKNGRASLVPVKIGLEGEHYFEVLTGLEAGVKVIVNPAKDVADGTKIKDIK